MLCLSVILVWTSSAVKLPHDAARKINSQQPQPTEGVPTSLREWLEEDKCFNVALAPQFNNQHSIFGLFQSLKDAGLLKHMSGIAACSGGVLPATFFAAGKDFATFKENFPKDGWKGFGPSEPKITTDFHTFINNSQLPEKLQDFQTPVAVSLSKWGTEKAMFEEKPNVTMLIKSKGDTREIVTAALATGSEGGIPDPYCPHCVSGFWPKKVGDAETVTDGAFSDLMGVEGLVALPKCNRVLHVLPLDYPHQVTPLMRKDIPGNPEDIVTLMFTQPPVGSHSYFIEPTCSTTIPFTSISLMCNPVMSKLFGSNTGLDTPPTKRTSGGWAQMMFDITHKATEQSVDNKWEAEVEPGHKAITLDTEELYKPIITQEEKKYNVNAAFRRDRWWTNFLKATHQENGSGGVEYIKIEKNVQTD